MPENRMEKSPRSYTLLQRSVSQCMHHSQRDTRSKSFIRRPRQDHFLRIQNLYHLGIIQKDRNNQKQENPVTGLTYKTLCKRQDGLHEMMSYTYLPFTNRHMRLNAGCLESWQEKTRVDSLEYPHSGGERENRA